MTVTFQHNVSLKPYNTLAVDVTAADFCTVTSVEALQQALSTSPEKQLLVLGGGSNLVLTSNFDGLVIRNAISGIEILDQTDRDVLIRIGAGENWDELVATCIAHGWFGLENLSWIPGSVGAAPIQNIGAYGVEIKDVLVAVETLQLSDLSKRSFTREQCQFGYRDSVFKQGEKGRQVIVAVRMSLSKVPQLNLEYGDIRRKAEEWGYDCETLTPAELRQIIIRLRSDKLPDPALLPNVGSFFKNPVVEKALYEDVCDKDPGVVAYPQADGRVKLAAGWLIDQLGFKGKKLGTARVHDRQALVLINEGQGSEDVLKLAHAIQQSVMDRWGIVLEIEPNLV